MTRPTIDEYYIAITKLAATRGTCPRRQVGCVLTDYENRVISIGYNGSAPGAPHCIDVPCPGAGMASGTGLDLCEAAHAEQSALLRVPDVNKLYNCYVTASPCFQCVKLLLNTFCQR